MSKSPSLRRIQADVRELALDPSDRYHASPLEDDMFEWHFTIRGADGTDFQGGMYHGRILLPPEYPFKPPHIIFLTPSGRFESGTKVCLSFSAYHPELWQPAWGIRLILEALISFLPTPADGAIGALDWTPAERKRLAQKSVSFCCPRCGKVADLLPELKAKEDGDKPRFAKEIEQLRLLQEATEGQNKQIKADKEGGAKHASKDVEDSVAAASTIQKGEQSTGNEDMSSLEEEKPASQAEEAPVEQPTVHDEALPARDDSAARLPAARPEQQDTESNEAQPLVAHPGPVEAQHDIDGDQSEVSWIIDPMLNVAIFLLSVICYLLVLKLSELREDLANLDSK